MGIPTGSLYKPKFTNRQGERQESRVWWAKYYAPGNSKPIRESTGTEDRKEALQFMRRRMAGLQDVAHTLAADRVRMPQVFDLLEADWKNKGAKSLADLMGKSKALREYWGARKLSEMSSSKIAAFVAHLRESKSYRTGKPLAPASINRLLAELRHALNLAHQHEPCLLARVPKFTMLKEPKPREGVLTLAQYQAVRDLLPLYARIALVIGYHTGARKGEIVAIRKQDIEARRIRIPDSKSDRPRYLPIYGDMSAEINMALSDESKYLVHDGKERVYSFRKAWATACTLAGVPSALFHDLRRTAVTNMINAGFSEKEAMEISGHRTRSMIDRYHIVAETRTSALGERMEAHLKAMETEAVKVTTH